MTFLVAILVVAVAVYYVPALYSWLGVAVVALALAVSAAIRKAIGG